MSERYDYFQVSNEDPKAREIKEVMHGHSVKNNKVG